MKRSTALRTWLGVLLVALPIAALAQQAFTTRTVYLRAGPDNGYPLVAQLAPGTPVYVQGCLEDWSWCDVEWANFRGWTWAPYLSYVYQGGRVPLYTYAPSLGIPTVVFSLAPYWDRYYYGRPWYGRRDYWVSRPPPRHYRPPGPPPRPGPPPPPRPPHGGPAPRPPVATPNPSPRPPGDVRPAPTPRQSSDVRPTPAPNGGQQPPANRPPPASQRSQGNPPSSSGPPAGGPPPAGSLPAGGAPITRN
ncbi:MAG: SH3 domain-containing protein [Casimicrobiaceae bacterium]